MMNKLRGALAGAALILAFAIPPANTAAALASPISLQGGNAKTYLDTTGFIPLPDLIRALSEKQINLIQ